MPRKAKPVVQEDEPIYLSPSSLNYWYSSGCPAAWEYSRQWEPKEKNEFAERGILVHAMLDGSVPVHTVTDRLALSLYQKLDGLRNFLGLRFLGVEVKQRFPILQGKVMWTRIVDAIAEHPTLGLVIVDYKTTGGMWKSLDLSGKVIPQAYGFQTPGCLMPPPPGMWKDSDWPKLMLYLVAPFRGMAETIHPIEYSEDDIMELLDSANMAANSIKWYREEAKIEPPKVRGKHCLTCPFRHPCYNEPGWEKLYTKKRKGKKE